MPLEELIMCFLLVNASLNKISVLVTGACQSLVHFSFTHPFYVRTVYKRRRISIALAREPHTATDIITIRENRNNTVRLGGDGHKLSSVTQLWRISIKIFASMLGFNSETFLNIGLGVI